MEEELEKLAQAMFSPMTSVNPIPFLKGLEKGVRKYGTDWINTDQSKMILFTILQQAFGTAFRLDSFDLYQWFEKYQKR